VEQIGLPDYVGHFSPSHGLVKAVPAIRSVSGAASPTPKPFESRGESSHGI
jgi:hypothetical protein